MEFQTFHKEFFRAVKGAFSRVTDTEHGDSQITLTDLENEIILNHFGKSQIHIGNVGSDRSKANKTFLLYPTLMPVKLNLVFPKPGKTELRLYLTKEFKPPGNYIWFVFINNLNDLIIGALPENIWNSLGQVDVIDDEYQEEIETTLVSGKDDLVDPHGRIATTIKNSTVVYVRDPRLAIMRFKKVNYKCEIDTSHTTFISQKTQMQYMEAHHFIPMKFQDSFKKIPLDNFDNIVCLCPNCHRAIHHSLIDLKQQLISKIYDKRVAMHHFPLEYINQFYNAIKVPNI